AALAVVGLGEVDELEVEGEGARELVGGILREYVDAGDGVLHGVLRGLWRGRCGARLCGARRGGGGFFGFAVGDGGEAQLFYGLEDRIAGLLAEDFAEQRAERAHVAAQGSFLEFAGDGFEFRETLRPVCRGPEGRHYGHYLAIESGARGGKRCTGCPLCGLRPARI